MNTSGLFTGSFAEALEEEMLTVDEIKEKLIRTEKGKVKQTISNCMLVLRYDPILKNQSVGMSLPVKQILLEICRGKDGESILQIQMKIM